MAALKVGMIVVPLVAFARLRQAVLQGLGRVTAGQIPETLVQPLVLLGLVGMVQLAPGIERSGLVAVALYAISAAVACLAGVLLLHRLLPPAVRNAVPEYRTAAWIKSAAPFVWMLGMNVVVTNADTIIVGMLAGSASAGVYRLVSQAAMLVAFPLTCVNMAVAPTIAALYARGDTASLQAIASGAARAILMASVPIAAVLVAVGPTALRLFGPEFVGGYPSLVVLVAAYLLNAAMGTAGYLLIMTRCERAVAAVFGCGAALNVAGNLLMIPRFGIAGAAVATALSVGVVSVAFAVLAQRNLGIHPTALPTRRGSPGEAS
jgi:O-antigen/teichoic acid export membrane protein